MKTPRSKRETKAASLTGLVFGISAATALAAGYSSAIKSDGPLAYYQFGDSSLRTNINANIGSAGSSANATNINVRRIPGAIVGSANPAAYFDSSARTIIPWTADLNPAATTSFTIEAWFYPTSDKVDGSFVGPAPIMNRYSYSGVNRQGWAYFQRNPDSSYSVPGHQSDVGWNFRTYRGSGSSTGINVTSQKPYRLGAWQHVVTVWEASTQTAVIYVDGQPAAQINIRPALVTSPIREIILRLRRRTVPQASALDPITTPRQAPIRSAEVRTRLPSIPRR